MGVNDGRAVPQRILVFQQNGSGENRIRGILRYGGTRFSLVKHDINAPLHPVIEDGRGFLPETIDADLVIDYLQHPDLSCELWSLCGKLGVPVVASGRKGGGEWVATPRTCCALPRGDMLGQYGRLFGTPEVEVTLDGDMIAGITVLRGAPCGATWEAAGQTVGIPAGEAPAHLGLRLQFFCKADPSGWDVFSGRSPVHTAAEIHSAALKKAIWRSQSGV